MSFASARSWSSAVKSFYSGSVVTHPQAQQEIKGHVGQWMPMAEGAKLGLTQLHIAALSLHKQPLLTRESYG